LMNLVGISTLKAENIVKPSLFESSGKVDRVQKNKYDRKRRNHQ
jgi:hypothetical protein